MTRDPPDVTRTDPPCPHTTLFRSFSYDLRVRAPQVSFTSPDPTAPAGMLIDFARLPTVQSDDEEKYAYLDYQHGVEWGPVQALKFGVKYTDHDRGSDRKSTRMNSRH